MRQENSSAAGAAPFEKAAEALLALAIRCEREEPSTELNELIAEAVGWQLRNRHAVFAWRSPSGQYAAFVPDFTGSLDAAVTLVPPNRFGWNVESKSGGTKANAMIARRYFGQAHTEALALCAAALRARAALAESSQ